MKKIEYEIINKFGEISSNKDKTWNLELNLIKWNNNQPKFDIRTWNLDHDKMGKGITLNHDELINLNKLISEIINQEY